MIVGAAIAAPLKMALTSAVLSVAYAKAWRTATLSNGGIFALKKSRSVCSNDLLVKPGMLLAVVRSCAVIFQSKSYCPAWYALNAVAGSLTKSISTSLSFVLAPYQCGLGTSTILTL